MNLKKLFVIAAILGNAAGCDAEDRYPRSPDGKFVAERVSGDNGTHLRVKKADTGEVVLTTHAQYDTPNEVKAGRFSADSTMIAAAFHYGHAGNYTWVGVFGIKDGKLVAAKRLDGWTTTIPDSVFTLEKNDDRE